MFTFFNYYITIFVYALSVIYMFRRKIMKPRVAVIIIILTVALSGIAGFSGAYLANSITENPAVAIEETSTQKKYGGSVISDEQLSAYLDEVLSGYLESYSPLNSPDAEAYDTSLMSTPAGKTMSDILTIPEIAALTSNSVVEVYTETVTGGGRMGQYISTGAGSGVIISSNGYIITNNHVIDGARKITVLLKNGTEYEATLVGRDRKTDLAVLKVNADGLQPAVFGNSDALETGELAVAIGNPLGKLGGTVSEGIISALSRNIDIDGETMTLLQTTAAVNPGNSGGGLFNCYGELIGVVNAKSSGSDIEGIGFAIPVNTVKTITEAIIQYGYVPGRIDFEATLVDILDQYSAMMYRVQTTGVYVSQANADSVLRAGDRIISIDGKTINSSADVRSLIDTHKVGDTLTIVVARNGQNTTVQLQLKQARS